MQIKNTIHTGWILILIPLMSLLHAQSTPETQGVVRLFDGQSFQGWEGNLTWFRIEAGCIVGGSLEKRIPHNEFLCTEREYKDFELRLTCKLIDNKGNAGIQIRSRRIPNHHEMIGYQADISPTLWGCLYDESRRKHVLARPDPKIQARAVNKGDWNEYLIRCVGKRVQLYLNGIQTVDYLESDDSLEQVGIIGLQIHGGRPSEIWYKDITIKELK